MKILIAGATGFIGKELTNTLLKSHDIAVLGREMTRLAQIFPHKIIEKITWNNLDAYDAKQFDIIINLSGSNIGAKRWSKRVKEDLISSRVSSNHHLIEWLIKKKANPHYYSANAVGIYGAHFADDDLFDENYQIYSANPNDFLTQIGLAWEESLNAAIKHGIQVTTLRFGVVLKKSEGMLKKLALPYALGLGSVLGTGNQVISWIHYKDLVNAVLFLLEHPEITGPVNITSPQPVAQKEFAIQFAQVLKRPILLKTPAFFINVLFGEMGEYLLLKGQKVIPKRLLDLGFKFIYPDIATALKHEYEY